MVRALTPSDINREAEIIIKRKSFFWLRRSRTKRRSAFLHGLLFFSAQRKASWKLPNGTIQCLIYASALVSLLLFFSGRSEMRLCVVGENYFLFNFTITKYSFGKGQLSKNQPTEAKRICRGKLSGFGGFSTK